MDGDVLVVVPHPEPVLGDPALCCTKVELARAHQAVQVVLQRVFARPDLVVVGERLRPQVLRGVVAAELKRDEMVELVSAARAVGDAVGREYLVAERLGDVAVRRRPPRYANLPDGDAGERGPGGEGTVGKRVTVRRNPSLR